MGKDYPKGFDYFRKRLHNAFMKNKDVRDPETIQKLLSHGEFVVKEIEALYMLKKYRYLKRQYYLDPNEKEDGFGDSREMQMGSNTSGGVK